MIKDRLTKQLVIDEGYKKKPYRDTVGKLSIGVGRNLDDKGLRADEIQLMLSNDIDESVQELAQVAPWYLQMNDVRQEVLINMHFNMGWPVLSQFKNTLAAMQRGDYDQAAQGMLASKWATQVGQRAKRLAEEMRTGNKQ